MKICFSSAPFGHPGYDDFAEIGDFLPNGSVQWAPRDNGTVPQNPQTMLSVQPSMKYETRALGAPSDFETFKFDGSSLAIRPRFNGAGDGPDNAFVIAARAL
jgi:hypothetical protein